MIVEWLELASHRNANLTGEHMQHGRRLAVGDVGDQSEGGVRSYSDALDGLLH